MRMSKVTLYATLYAARANSAHAPRGSYALLGIPPSHPRCWFRFCAFFWQLSFGLLGDTCTQGPKKWVSTPRAAPEEYWSRKVRSWAPQQALVMAPWVVWSSTTSFVIFFRRFINEKVHQCNPDYYWQIHLNLVTLFGQKMNKCCTTQNIQMLYNTDVLVRK